MQNKYYDIKHIKQFKYLNIYHFFSGPMPRNKWNRISECRNSRDGTISVEATIKCSNYLLLIYIF